MEMMTEFVLCCVLCVGMEMKIGQTQLRVKLAQVSGIKMMIVSKLQYHTNCFFLRPSKAHGKERFTVVAWLWLTVGTTHFDLVRHY